MKCRTGKHELRDDGIGVLFCCNGYKQLPGDRWVPADGDAAPPLELPRLRGLRELIRARQLAGRDADEFWKRVLEEIKPVVPNGIHD